jgi:hypothetical protein
LPFLFMGSVVDYRLGLSVFRFLVGARYYVSLFQNVYAGFGAQPSSYSTGTGILF